MQCPGLSRDLPSRRLAAIGLGQGQQARPQDIAHACCVQACLQIWSRASFELYFMEEDPCMVCPLGADPESPRPQSGDLHQYCTCRNPFISRHA